MAHVTLGAIRRQHLEPVFAFVIGVLRPLLWFLFRWRMIGLENVPPRGGVIVATNHISYFDPLPHGYFLVRAGRRPRFLAKAELWRSPFMRFIVNGCGQIKVQRGTGEHGPVEAAVAALRKGECVVVYPEGTVTRNPDLTPMAGKTGLARMAITTGLPVLPLVVWGSHWVVPKGRKAVHKFRRTIVVRGAEPMTFPEFAGRDDDPQAIKEITERVMAELDRLVREVQKIHPDGAAVPPLVAKEAAE